MQNKLASLVLMASLAGLTACGESVSPQSALDDALRQIEIAQQGYAQPAGEKATALEQHRSEALAEAARTLQDVLSGGTPAQQVAARQLLAEIRASMARMAAQEAAAAYGQVAPQAVALLDIATAAESADSRRVLLDERRPAVIQAVREEIQQQQTRQQNLQAEAQQLQQKIEAEEAQLKTINTRRDEAMARAQELRAQAFVAEGDEQYRLYDQAAAAEREGTVAAAEGDRHRLTIDMIQSQLAVIDSQLKLTNDLIREMQERVQAAQQRQQEVEQGVAEAVQARGQQVQQLSAALEEVSRRFNQQVDQKLQQASERIAEAVQHLEAAQGQATGQVRQAVEQDLLGARAAQASLLAEHLLVVDGFHDVLRALQQAVAGVEDAQVPALQTLTQDLAAKKSDLVAQAQQAIQSGQQLATQLGDQDQADRLAQYAQRINAISTQ